MDISNLRVTSLSRLRPLRKPTDVEKKQVTRRLEFSYTFKLIRTTIGSIFLAALCSLMLEEFNNTNTFWFIAGILFSAILMLIMINSFASLNIVSFILDKAREGDFDIVDCKILGIGAKLDTLSNKEQAQLQEAINKAVLEDDFEDFLEKSESAIAKRMLHLSDTFQEYLFYLIEQKGLTNADVYKRAIMTKQLFSKIKNNPQYHPDKDTALKLCIGAKLNLDETRDLLARAGYALSPCDKKDIIFTYFIERGMYDMIDIDIVLEEFGLPCFIE
jgi:hypothetical protein